MKTFKHPNRALAANVLFQSQRATGDASADIDLVTTIERLLDQGLAPNVVKYHMMSNDEDALFRLAILSTH